MTFGRQKTILQAIFTDRSPFLKRIIAKLIGFDAAYHRFTGKVTVEKLEKDVPGEHFAGHAIWELMYFGRSRSAFADRAANSARESGRRAGMIGIMQPINRPRSVLGQNQR